MSEHVIIGNGVAAANAIEGIRNGKDDGRITVISKEDHPAYSRPLISYLLGGEVDEDSMIYRGEEFYDEKDVEVRYGEKAISIEPEERYVELDGGDRIAFENLLIATGGSPILPPVEGNELEGVFTFTKWKDVKRIQDYIDENVVESIAIVGGGLIGLKTAEAFIELGIEVNIIELMDNILNATFDKTASGILEGYLEKLGCNLFTGTTVEKISGNEKVEKALLQNGDEIDTDMVIFAIGVSPNVKLAEDTGIEIDDGIIAKPSMQTSLENIYAAGDVAEIPDLIAGERRPIAIWPNASRQGYIAGTNMGGGNECYEGSFAMNSVKIKNLPTISVGLTDPERNDYEVMKEVREDGSVYRKVIIDGDRLIGAIFVGDVDRAGIYTGLIKKGVDISDFKDRLLDEDFGLIHLPDDYRKGLLSGEGMKL